jgi:hypothetical protein
MKKILIILSFVSIISFGQTTNDTNSVDENDTIITKERYLGLNIGTFIKQIMDPNLSVRNFSIMYKVEKSNRIFYQYKISTYMKETNEIYGFNDSLGNMISRTYVNSYANIDARAGIGLSDKLGYGRIYVSSSVLVGYAQLSKRYDDFVVYVKDSVAEGFGSEGADVSKADYITFGLDFNFGYEIDLGEHLMLSLEYNPEFSLHSQVSSKYYLEDVSEHPTSYINSNFNIFNVNLLYHF